MTHRWQSFLLAACLGLSGTACSGGTLLGTGPDADSPPSAASQAAPAVPAVAGADLRASSAHDGRNGTGLLVAIDGPLRDLSDAGDDTPNSGTSGACQKGIKSFVPDRAGNADSSELQVFFEPSCKRLARDTVRVYTPVSASSQTVAVTVHAYGVFGTLLWTRTTHATLSNASFDSRGYPIASDGFVRTASSELARANASRATVWNGERIVQPQSGNVAAFCTDSAGYNTIGFPQTGQTFGWDGGYFSGGTRTANPDGSVTWNGTHDNTSFVGTIGSLSIATGSANTACPIVTPQFTLAGGTVRHTSAALVSATLENGLLLDLSISRITNRGGMTLTAATNAHLWYADPSFITGAIDLDNAPEATFSVNAFGDGSLVILSSNTTYPVVDWVAVL